MGFSKVFNRLVERFPGVAHLRIKSDLPNDSAPESPMKRLLICQTIEASIHKCLTENTFSEYLVKYEGELAQVKHVLYVGKNVILIDATHWHVFEEKGSSDFVRIEHLSEPYNAVAGDTKYCILRGRFLILLIGGILYYLDCGEILDIPMVLMTGIEKGSQLYENFETFVLRKPDGECFAFEFEEFAPFGYHVEQVRQFRSPYFAGVVFKGTAYAEVDEDKKDRFVYRKIKTGEELKQSPVVADLAADEEGAFQVKDNYLRFFTTTKQEGVLDCETDEVTQMQERRNNARLYENGIIYRKREGKHVVLHKGKVVYEELMQQNVEFLGVCKKNFVYFSNHIIFAGGTAFRRFTDFDEILFFDAATFVVRKKEQIKVIQFLKREDVAWEG